MLEQTLGSGDLAQGKRSAAEVGERGGAFRGLAVIGDSGPEMVFGLMEAACGKRDRAETVTAQSRLRAGAAGGNVDRESLLVCRLG